MPVDPGIAALLELIAASGYPPLHEGTPGVARKAFRAMTVDAVAPDARIPVGSAADVVVAGVPCRLYRPEGEGPFPTLVFVHGGGFVIGDLDTHDQTCRSFCSGAEVVVLSVDYRLAPEHPFPAAVDDVLAVVGEVSEHLDQYGGTDVLAVGGDSAGGNLSAVAAQQFRDVVSAQVLIYPAVHMAGEYASREENATGYFLEMDTMTWFAGHYLGEGAVDGSVDLADPRHSPLLGTLEGLPPAVVVTAEFDPLRDEGAAYAEALRAADVEVDYQEYAGMIHGFIDMGLMSPAAADALADVVARTKRLLG